MEQIYPMNEFSTGHIFDRDRTTIIMIQLGGLPIYDLSYIYCLRPLNSVLFSSLSLFQRTLGPESRDHEDDVDRSVDDELGWVKPGLSRRPLQGSSRCYRSTGGGRDAWTYVQRSSDLPRTRKSPRERPCIIPFFPIADSSSSIVFSSPFFLLSLSLSFSLEIWNREFFLVEFLESFENGYPRSLPPSDLILEI